MRAQGEGGGAGCMMPKSAKQCSRGIKLTCGFPAESLMAAHRPAFRRYGCGKRDAVQFFQASDDLNALRWNRLLNHARTRVRLR
jgi:ribosomal protein S27AE